jgi:hypothetical protein
MGSASRRPFRSWVSTNEFNTGGIIQRSSHLFPIAERLTSHARSAWYGAPAHARKLARRTSQKFPCIFFAAPPPTPPPQGGKYGKEIFGSATALQSSKKSVIEISIFGRSFFRPLRRAGALPVAAFVPNSNPRGFVRVHKKVPRYTFIF